jgi:DNA-binding MarR family transcriptional regulator
MCPTATDHSEPVRKVTRAELRAWSGLLHAHRRLSDELDAELLRAHGISLAEFDVLVTLADAPAQRLRMAELAGTVLLSRSGLTRLVDRLQAQGLVGRVRCDADARGLNATITAAGLKRVREAAVTHVDGVRRHFLDRLTPDDVVALTAIWRRLEADADPDACETALPAAA